MSRIVCITLARKGVGPCIAQVTWVPVPWGCKVKSIRLWASIGAVMSSFIETLFGPEGSTIDSVPRPTLPLPSKS